ncbi:MAG: hypothetical protein PHX60_15270 [Giesbergeria sp.]|uniref:hypothetical protein n=1 Tax=Giesbergeria sp. TaxID=2818473 RepID=UPI0026084F1C|nr:hypothetical protein [Giesbergeria sp.]MDD2611012.1 hypothetical protein [Giesbergeria sp.]
MKREVKREKRLPAFSINVDELEILWKRLIALFDENQTVYSTIKISLPSEELEFDTIEELKQYPQLKGNITRFSLWFSQASKRCISIKSSSLLNSQAGVSASADNEAWCAGAIETTFSFFQTHKLWYHWFVAAPIGWILLLLANGPTIAGFFLPKGEVIDKFFYAGWIAIMLAIAIPYIGKNKLLPSSVIRITDEEGFIRKHGVELSLLIAVVSAVLTVVGWFVGSK